MSDNNLSAEELKRISSTRGPKTSQELGYGNKAEVSPMKTVMFSKDVPYKSLNENQNSNKELRHSDD